MYRYTGKLRAVEVELYAVDNPSVAQGIPCILKPEVHHLLLNIGRLLCLVHIFAIVLSPLCHRGAHSYPISQGCPTRSSLN